MGAWGRDQKVGKKIRMMADGSADFTKKLATDTQEWQKVISDAKITLQ